MTITAVDVRPADARGVLGLEGNGANLSLARSLVPRRRGLAHVLWAVGTAGSISAVGVLVGADLVLLVILAVAWTGWSVAVAAALPRWSVRTLVRRTVGAAASMTVVVPLLELGRPGLGHLVLLAGAFLASVSARWLVVRDKVSRVVVVGSSESVEGMFAAWGGRNDITVAGVEIVGRDEAGGILIGSGGSGPAGWEGVARLADECRADFVVCGCGDLSPDDLRRLRWALDGSTARLLVRSAVSEVAPRRLSTQQIGGSSMIEVSPSVPSRAVRVAKSCFDRLGAASGLVVLAPVLLAVGLLIRLDSPGPALFKQVRVGRSGETFTMYKFRTMVTNAEAVKSDLSSLDEGNGVLFKIRQDPRITSAGRWLRRSSLDELPQLLNVVRGEMSLVGPRPALPSEVAQYDDVARRRLVVRPGLTGVWQVSGRSDLGWEESLRLDLDYADNVDVARDLGICLATVRAVTSGRGAY